MVGSRLHPKTSPQDAKRRAPRAIGDELSDASAMLFHNVGTALRHHLDLLEHFFQPFKLGLRKGGPSGPATYVIEGEHHTWILAMRIPKDLLAPDARKSLEDFVEWLQLTAQQARERARR